MSAWYSAPDAMLSSAKHTKDTQVLPRYAGTMYTGVVSRASRSSSVV
jgi:hypothetical protein